MLELDKLRAGMTHMKTFSKPSKKRKLRSTGKDQRQDWTEGDNDLWDNGILSEEDLVKMKEEENRILEKLEK